MIGMTTNTVPHFFADSHTLTFDAALRDALQELPAMRDLARAGKGLVMALNGLVTRQSDTIALVRSQTDPEVVYQVQSRGGCDCQDAQRLRRIYPDGSVGQRACKHWYASVLVACAHINLAIKGYTPEADPIWYPAVALDEEHYGRSGFAMEQSDGSWWFEYHNRSGGYSTEVTSLELWERTPVHQTYWTGEVTGWERWLQG
jgi:hypothetical protein